MLKTCCLTLLALLALTACTETGSPNSSEQIEDSELEATSANAVSTVETDEPGLEGTPTPTEAQAPSTSDQLREEQKYARDLSISVESSAYTNNDLIALIELEYLIAEQRGDVFDLEASIFLTLQKIQEAEFSYRLAPEKGVSVGQDEIEARLHSYLGLEFSESPAASEEFNEKLEALRQRVGMSESQLRTYVEKILYTDRLQATFSGPEAEAEFQRFLSDRREDFNLQLVLNSDINNWLIAQVRSRIE